MATLRLHSHLHLQRAPASSASASASAGPQAPRSCFSCSSIRFTGQSLVVKLVPATSQFRISTTCNSSVWGRRADRHHRIVGDGGIAWTRPWTRPRPRPLCPGPHSTVDLVGKSWIQIRTRTQIWASRWTPSRRRPPPPHEKGSLSGSWSWSSSSDYFLSPDKASSSRRSRASLPAAWPLEEMNFKKDVAVPISTPPAVGVPREEQKNKSSRMTRQGAIVALAYMGCAVMLVMFNKSALSSYKFPCANIITVLQMVCSTALLYVLRKMDIINFSNEGTGIIDSSGDGFVPFRILQKTAPLSLSYLFYMVVGMASIRGVNVPMYTTLRRTTVLLTMVLEYFLTGQKHSMPIVSSVGFIVLGAFIAGARDLSFDAHGYLLVLVSNLTTAMYLTTISRLGKTTGLNSFGLMWCNGIICGPILLLWTMISGELGMALRFPAVFLPGFQLVILLSCMMAFALNYTIFLNTSLNSPLTQTMCGNLKDFGTILIGWVWFGGLPFDWLNVLGQFLGFLGSGLYAYCKIKGI